MGDVTPIGIPEGVVPPGAVLLGQPEQPKIEDLTFVDLLGLAFTRAGAHQEASESGSAKREYALAKTAIEDALTRFNRGRSMDLGIFHVTDTEDPGFLQAVQEAVNATQTEKEDPAA